MLFTLEALQAKHGDSLLLHFGASSADPQLVVIDGGPAGVFKGSLRPRLDELKARHSPDSPLPVRMAMLSHIDDDHVHGLLDLTDRLLELRNDGEEQPYRIATLWHNSFDDILKKAGASTASVAPAVNALSTAAAASVAADLGDGAMLAALGLSQPAALIAASVPQGRQLADNAKQLKIEINKQFGGDLVAAPTKSSKTVKIAGLELRVLGPNQERLDALKDDWKKQLKKKPGAKGAELQALAAEFLDKSVYNLSSIVVLARFGGRTMLLTGDARGDDILGAVRRAGLLKQGRMHVDLLKEPHHGSDRNVATEFFRAITADHYVISADGKHGNPDLPMLKMLTEARADDGEAYTIHMTNKLPEVDKFLRAEQAEGKNFTVVYRESAALSLRIDLGEALAS
jgi:hypothetical protein